MLSANQKTEGGVCWLPILSPSVSSKQRPQNYPVASLAYAPSDCDGKVERGQAGPESIACLQGCAPTADHQFRVIRGLWKVGCRCLSDSLRWQGRGSQAKQGSDSRNSTPVEPPWGTRPPDQLSPSSSIDESEVETMTATGVNQI